MREWDVVFRIIGHQIVGRRCLVHLGSCIGKSDGFFYPRGNYPQVDHRLVPTASFSVLLRQEPAYRLLCCCQFRIYIFQRNFSLVMSKLTSSNEERREKFHQAQFVIFSHNSFFLESFRLVNDMRYERFLCVSLKRDIKSTPVPKVTEMRTNFPVLYSSINFLPRPSTCAFRLSRCKIFS